MVLVTLAVAALTLWGVRWFIGPVSGAPALLLGLWFALLWWVVQRRTAQAGVIPP
jgi:hypothetical protein